MIARHKYELLNRLERVKDLGSCEIRLAELKKWYGRERITKSVWMDLIEQWTEISNNDSSLLIGPGEGIYTIIYNDGLSVPDDSWWQDIRSWAGQEF